MAKRKQQKTYDQRSLELRDQLDTQNPTTSRPLEPVSDPMSVGQAHQTSTSKVGRIVTGRIIQSMPHLNWYRVHFQTGYGTMPCCKLSGDSNLMPLGTREVGPLLPDNDVLVFMDPELHFGIILGAYPRITENPNLLFPDWVNQGGGTGVLREGYYKEYLTTLQRKHGVKNFSASRPLDATSYDWGRINELGGRMLMTPFMIQAMADEITGLQCFYFNQLCRLTGHNLDIRSAATEFRVRDNESEFQIYSGEAIYPWEQLGQKDKDGDPVKENEAEDVLHKRPVAALDVDKEKAVPFHRKRIWGGYAGQGGLREVVGPDKTPVAYEYDDDNNPNALFREQVGLDGSWALSSAKSIVLAKRAAQISPKLIKHPNTPNGEEYKASGTYGEGPDHKIKDLEEPEGEHNQWLTAAGALDFHAHLFKWKALHPFVYNKELFTAEEGDLATVSETPDYSTLESQHCLDRPTPIKIKIDERYGETNFYQVLSHLTMTEDGIIKLECGYGNSLIFGPDGITLDSPADIKFRTGRNIVAMAGHDINLTARESLDLSATNKDLRIKSQKNMQLLAKEGGILVETKSTGNTQTYKDKVGEDVESAGITFLAKAASVNVLGAGVYVKALEKDGIALDSNNGDAPITTHSTTFERRIKHDARDVYGLSKSKTVNVYTSTSTHINTPMTVNGYLFVDGSGLFKNGINVVFGHIATSQSENFQGKVGVLKEASLEDAKSKIETIDLYEKNYSTAATETFEAFVAAYYGEKKISNPETYVNMAFSFRTEAQYGTEDFVWLAPSWQQQGDSGDGWTEEAIDYQGDTYMVYPGKKNWRDKQTLLTYEPNLLQSATGEITEKAPTADNYEDAKYSSLQVTKLEGGLKHI